MPPHRDRLHHWHRDASQAAPAGLPAQIPAAARKCRRKKAVEPPCQWVAALQRRLLQAMLLQVMVRGRLLAVAHPVGEHTPPGSGGSCQS